MSFSGRQNPTEGVRGGCFPCSLMNCLFQLLLLRRRNSEKWKNVTTLLHSGHSPWFEVHHFQSDQDHFHYLFIISIEVITTSTLISQHGKPHHLPTGDLKLCWGCSGGRRNIGHLMARLSWSCLVRCFFKSLLSW